MTESKLKYVGHNKTVITGFVLAMVCLLAIGFFLQKSLHDIKQITLLRAQARTTAFHLKSLNFQLAEAETGQRGYLLTADETHLDSYHRALRDIPEIREKLETLMAGKPVQIERLKKIDELMDKRFKKLADALELMQNGSSQRAIQVVKQGQGHKYMKELRDLLDLMDDEQLRLVDDYSDKADEISAQGTRIVWFSSFCTTLTVGFLIGIFLRNERRRISAEESLIELNQSLEGRRKLASRIIQIQNEIATTQMSPTLLKSKVAQLSMELTKSDGSIIEGVDGDHLVYEHAIGMAAPYVGMRLPIQGSFSGLCVQQGSSLVCQDSETDDRVNREACRKVGLRSMIVVPILYSGKTIAVLKNYSAVPHHYKEETINALSLIAGLASTALGQAQEFEQKLLAIEELECTQAELTASRDLAQSATEAKSRFLATMSHEVRTPLNAILGMTNLIFEGNLSKEQEEYARAIKSSGQALLALVNDVLDVSKIEAGKLELDQVDFDIASVLQEVIKSFEFMARQKEIKLETAIDSKLPTYVSGDSGRVRQILINLIGNAMKFTPRGSVSVKVTCLDPATGQLRFDIRDTGAGIGPDVVKLLFKEFTQGDSSTTRIHGGTGLGLSICKKLVEMMGGSIGVESRLGEGSNFWFTLKMAPAQHQQPSIDSSDLRDTALPVGPWRILVGEDNQFNQVIIAKTLESLGLHCDVVGNGREVVNALLSLPYDLILMDCNMPLMDGYEATKFIRTSPTITQSEIPIIAMTANALVGDKEKSISAGMDDHITKPLDPKKVSATLAFWLDQVQSKKLKAASDK